LKKIEPTQACLLWSAWLLLENKQSVRNAMESIQTDSLYSPWKAARQSISLCSQNSKEAGEETATQEQRKESTLIEVLEAVLNLRDGLLPGYLPFVASK
jgi:hypothetical protein